MANALARAVKVDALSLIILGDKPSDAVSLADPDTGEVVLLEDASPQLIAAVLGRIQLQIDDELQRLKDAKIWLGRTMVERMDSEGEWTQRSRGVKVTASSPAAKRYTWDGDKLRIILDELVAAKLISRAAALRACESRVENVPVISGITKLLKLAAVHPEIEQRILWARSENTPGNRTVRVEVNPGEV